jgi:hypothetical protein
MEVKKYKVSFKSEFLSFATFGSAETMEDALSLAYRLFELKYGLKVHSVFDTIKVKEVK